MKIETKFDINNLIQHKFDNEAAENHIVLEILDIHTDTCYAGTQIFYYVRPIILKKNFGGRGMNDLKWSTSSSVGANGRDTGVVRYREDELIECDQKWIDIILNKGEQV